MSTDAAAGGAPPLSRAILSHIAHDWPEFAEVRAAARALSQKSRLSNALSIAVNEVRVSLAAALLCSDQQGVGCDQREDAEARSETVRRALRLHFHARAIVSDCAEPLGVDWRLSDQQIGKVRQAFIAVVGGDASPSPTSAAPIPTSPPRASLETYAQSVHLFLAAIAQGMPAPAAMTAIGTLGRGSFSHDDKCFFPENVALGPIADRVGLLPSARRLVVSGCEGEGDTTIFVLSGAVAAIVSDRALRSSWAEGARRRTEGLEALPDFISLPRDEDGRPVIPQSRVTALVEARHAWASELGTLDAVTRSITRGQLVMPRISAPSQQKALRNHPSWESDEDAKRALGPVIAKWLASGVLEFVAWDDRMPILLQPCGAVPKGTAPFYRLITDARFANKFYSDWGVTYTTAAQLSSTLNRCDFHFSIDISDAYHLSLWAGCGGELRPVKRPVIVSKGPGQPNEVSWVDALVNGCTPSTCRGGCDKDLSGIMIDGFVFRFAACQFGQKTAGSPLGSIVRAVARFFARLPEPVHVASWVDDLIFIMSTPDHGECAGFEGGCSVCMEYHERALQVQEMWHAKARRLNIPLSAKGHPVGQRGAFTGVAIDSFRGRFNMLPDKMASLVKARQELAAAEVSTPRLIARVRGKALHYGCAIPFIAAAAPSLSQLMHGRESGAGPVEVPSLDVEKELEFDWDMPVRMSERARAALDFMRIAVERYGDAGQPLWPVVPSSLYGAFLAGEAKDARVLVITFDASVDGWGAVVRSSPEEKGTEIVGGYRLAAPLLGRAFVDPAALPACPASQVYRETLAGFLASRAASQLHPLADRTVLIRSDCTGAIAALRKGSFRSPALQNVALLHNRLFMDAGASPPLYLHAPGTVMKAEGVDDLSRSVARSIRASESTRALRDIVADEAKRWLGASLSLDLFATADNALVPRFFAQYPEPLAEGVDALAQPDWGRSRCPHCGALHRECAFAFPPRALLPAFVAKAKADGLRGIVIAPFTPSDPAWPSLAAASLTVIPEQKDRCLILPSSPQFIRDGEDLGGALRLAVMAVDFSRWCSRSSAGASTPCASHGEHRPRPSLSSTLDEADRQRIAQALLRLGSGPGGRKRAHAGR